MIERWLWESKAQLLSVLGGLAVIGCGVYCIGWFKPSETSFWNPDVAITCWVFCSTLDPLWGVITLVSGIAPIVGAGLMFTGFRRLGGLIAIISGIVILPVGLAPIMGGYLVLRQASTE